MHAPWYVYLIALTLALPIFILLAMGGWGLVKLLFSWVVGGEPPQRPKGQIGAQG
jgi:hypothetical protein